jgi:Lhr-like helicase
MLLTHVIMAYTPETSSELLQNIGRAGRNLEEAAEGTIISTDPLQDTAEDYINELFMRESFHNNSIVMNTRIAAGLHEKRVENH